MEPDRLFPKSSTGKLIWILVVPSVFVVLLAYLKVLFQGGEMPTMTGEILTFAGTILTALTARGAFEVKVRADAIHPTEPEVNIPDPAQVNIQLNQGEVR